MCLKYTLLTHDSTWYSSYEVTLVIKPEILTFNQLNDIVVIDPKFSVIYMTHIFDIFKNLGIMAYVCILNAIFIHFKKCKTEKQNMAAKKYKTYLI